MRIYVSNFPFDVTVGDLYELFSHFGTVTSVSVIHDLGNHNSRGFGFVQMLSSEEALTAIESLDAYEWHGRCLRVGEARASAARLILEEKS